MKFIKLFSLLIFIVFTYSCSTESPDNPRNGGIDKSANLKVLGASATDLLSDVTYTSMNIEIVYVEGSRPTDEAINIFKRFLEERTHKPDGISINLRSVQSSGNEPFTIDEIVAIEKEHRTAYNAGDEIAVWIYFADGSNEKDTNEKFILGSAFRNTSMVIYEKTIKNFANRTGAPSKAIIEAATLNHEFGHLFGLVDLGTTPVSNHEDPENEGHCVTENCLMKASIEFGGGVVDMINGSKVPDFDQACIDDLISVGGK